MFKGVASRALGVFALFTVVCGLGYTLVVTGIAQVAFPYRANGSLIKVDDKIVGSELIGQNFEDEDHMWGRIQNVTVVEGEDGGTAGAAVHLGGGVVRHAQQPDGGHRCGSAHHQGGQGGEEEQGLLHDCDPSVVRWRCRMLMG